MSHTSKQITLRSGVESVLDGAEVVCSNIATAEYTVDGQNKTGLTANLALPDRENWLRLGKGQAFTFQDHTYTVTDVTEKEMIVVAVEQADEEE